METVEKAPETKAFGFSAPIPDYGFVLDNKGNLKVNTTGNVLVDALECLQTRDEFIDRLMDSVLKENPLLYAALCLYHRDLIKGNKRKDTVQMIAKLANNESLFQRILFLLVKPNKEGTSLGYFKDLVKIWDLTKSAIAPHMHAWWISQDSYFAKKWMPAQKAVYYKGKEKAKVYRKNEYASALRKVLGISKKEYRVLKASAKTTEARLSAKEAEAIVIVGKGKNTTTQNILRLAGNLKKRWGGHVEKVLNRYPSTKLQLEKFFAAPKTISMRGVTNTQLKDLAENQDAKLTNAIADSSIKVVTLPDGIRMVLVVDGSGSMESVAKHLSSIVAELVKVHPALNSVLRFESGAEIVPMPETREFTTIYNFMCKRIMTGGSTNFEAALDLAYHTAVKEKWDLSKTVFLTFTDGAFDTSDFGNSYSVNTNEKKIMNVKNIIRSKFSKIVKDGNHIGNWIFFRMASGSEKGRLATSKQDNIALINGMDPNFNTILDLAGKMVDNKFEYNAEDFASALLAPDRKSVV